MDICWQSNGSTFYYAVQVSDSFSSKEQVSFNFMAAVTICSDLGAQKSKVCHCFHCSSSICHEVMGPVEKAMAPHSSTLATSCEELTHWKRLWCWEGLGAGGKGDDRGWDGWMASLTGWTWIWVHSRSWWWTGRPGVLRFTASQRFGHDWGTELNWIEYILLFLSLLI